MTFKKKVRRMYKKAKRFVKKYIRFLVRHTKAKDYSVLIYTILGLIAIILVISLLVSFISGIFKGDDEKKTPTTTEAISSTDTTEKESDLKSEALEIYNKNKQFLILVNASNPLDEGYTFVHHTLNCGYDVDERIYDDMLDMLTDLNAEDLHYSIISGYRSRADQQEIMNDRIDDYIAMGMTEEEANEEVKKSVQMPGTSEHETGLCFDISSEGMYILNDEVATYETNIWLAENSYRYGFILRYPKDKETITGITYEPWHFRYVGKEAALFMHKNDLTLEEFHQLIK